MYIYIYMCICVHIYMSIHMYIYVTSMRNKMATYDIWFLVELEEGIPLPSGAEKKEILLV